MSTTKVLDLNKTEILQLFSFDRVHNVKQNASRALFIFLLFKYRVHCFNFYFSLGHCSHNINKHKTTKILSHITFVSEE